MHTSYQMFSAFWAKLVIVRRASQAPRPLQEPHCNFRKRLFFSLRVFRCLTNDFITWDGVNLSVILTKASFVEVRWHSPCSEKYLPSHAPEGHLKYLPCSWFQVNLLRKIIVTCCLLNLDYNWYITMVRAFEQTTNINSNNARSRLPVKMWSKLLSDLWVELWIIWSHPALAE